MVFSAPRAGSAGLRTVAVLGSTGSIGTQALELISRNPDRFTVVAISGGHNLDLLARQAVKFRVEAVGAASGKAADLVEAIGGYAAQASLTAYAPTVVVGPNASTTLAGCGADVVLNGITGSIGLRPTLAALQAGSLLALANKESLVAGGDLVKQAAAPDQIVPVDSEHSAVAQCLRAGRRREVSKLVLTASGGPFRGWTRERLEHVTPQQALAHPTWSMGPVITTNSATLVNKGLEVIEAHLLFDVPFDQIQVVVHPQSAVHSMVEFTDGSTLAQASPPDMRLPIALGLGWPDRVPGAGMPCDWTTAATWEFFPLDDRAFPAVRLARHVGGLGATYPAVYNASNEECVAAFLDGCLRFTQIVQTVEHVVHEHRLEPGALTVSAVLRAERWARARTRQLLDLP